MICTLFIFILETFFYAGNGFILPAFIMPLKLILNKNKQKDTNIVSTLKKKVIQCQN